MTTVPFPSKPKGNRGMAGGDELQCEACWRVIKNPGNAYAVLASYDIGSLLSVAADGLPNGGWFAIGPECARDIPATHKVKGWGS